MLSVSGPASLSAQPGHEGEVSVHWRSVRLPCAPASTLLSSGQTPRPTNQLQAAVWLAISVMLVVIIISGVVMGLLYTDNTNLHHRLNVLEGEMLVIRDLMRQVRPQARRDSDGMTIN